MFASKFFAVVALGLVSFSSVSFSSVSLASNSVPAGEGEFFSQVFTPWIAVVKDGVSAKACALEVAEITGFDVLQALEITGILVVVSPTADGSALANVPCVLAYEPEQIVIAL